MADWGAYDPDNFSALPDHDLNVHPETRMQFCLALCGVKAAYECLQKEGHFFAMSVSMRRIFAMMPTRYPYYNIGNSATSVPAPSCSYTSGVSSHVSSQGGVPKSRGPSKKLVGAHTDRSRSTGPSALPTRKNTAAARAHSLTVHAHSPELGVHLNDSMMDLSASDISVCSAARTNKKQRRRVATKNTKLAKVLQRKPMKKNGRAPGSSIFAPQPLLDISREFPHTIQLQETINRTCDNARSAFKLALHSLFSYSELTSSTATQLDRKRLQAATALVRNFCQMRYQPEPTIAQFHTAFFLAQKTAKQ